jgi:hypothetical protein
MNHAASLLAAVGGTDDGLVTATWWLVAATFTLVAVGAVAAVAAFRAVHREWIAIQDARRQGKLELKPYVLTELFVSGKENRITNIGSGPAVRCAAVFIHQELPEHAAWNGGICWVGGIAADSSQVITSQQMRNIPALQLDEGFGHVVNRFCLYEDVFGNRSIWENGRGFVYEEWVKDGAEPRWAGLWNTVMNDDGLRIEIRAPT